jgi:serpin B
MQVGAGHAFIIAEASEAKQYVHRSRHVLMRTPSVLLFALLLTGAGCGRGSRQEPLVACNNDFGFDVYAKLSDRSGNFVFSPHSVLTALGMAYAGARTDTAAEIARAARFPERSNELHHRFRSTLRPFENRPGAENYALLEANAAWFMKGYPFRSEFAEVLDKDYGAGAKIVDFSDAEACRRMINDWVDKQTNHRIDGIVQPNQLTKYTRLVLTNVVYLKAAWGVNFEEKDTQPADFWIAPSRSVKAPMMHRTGGMSDMTAYKDAGDCEVLRLPCTHHSKLAVIVLLPKQRDGLPALERSLTGSRFQSIMNQAGGDYVIDIFLPRFALASSFEMKSTLGALGIRKAFDERSADFSGMSDALPLWLSAVTHRANIDCNEKGIEAAAATGGEIIGADDDQEPRHVTFRADHPFVFLIQHWPGGQVLFLGRVVDPSHS